MCLYSNAYQAKGTHFRKEARRSSTRTGSLAPALTMFKMKVTISCHAPQKTGCSTSSIVTTQPWPWDNLTMMRMEITVDNSHYIENVIFFFQIRLYKWGYVTVTNMMMGDDMSHKLRSLSEVFPRTEWSGGRVWRWGPGLSSWSWPVVVLVEDAAHTRYNTT